MRLIKDLKSAIGDKDVSKDLVEKCIYYFDGEVSDVKAIFKITSMLSHYNSKNESEFNSNGVEDIYENISFNQFCEELGVECELSDCMRLSWLLNGCFHRTKVSTSDDTIIFNFEIEKDLGYGDIEPYCETIEYIDVEMTIEINKKSI